MQIHADEHTQACILTSHHTHAYMHIPEANALIFNPFFHVPRCARSLPRQQQQYSI